MQGRLGGAGGVGGGGREQEIKQGRRGMVRGREEERGEVWRQSEEREGHEQERKGG